jgi:hypothetical protein
MFPISLPEQRSLLIDVADRSKEKEVQKPPPVVKGLVSGSEGNYEAPSLFQF